MREEAFKLFGLWAEPCCIPSLEGEELAILERHKLAEIWRPETLYRVGDVVQAYPRTGYRYGVIVRGISGLFAPAPWGTSLRERFTSGSVSFEVLGSDYENIYDIRGAAHEAWSIKAGRASHLVTTSAGNSRIEASLLHTQCRARAVEFAPLL
jgi:hypothetical protein